MKSISEIIQQADFMIFPEDRSAIAQNLERIRCAARSMDDEIRERDKQALVIFEGVRRAIQLLEQGRTAAARELLASFLIGTE